MKPIRSRILYVDDSRMDRELVRHALEEEHGGFELEEAASKQEFFSRLSEGSYELVLSDFNILGFEGLDVMKAVWEKDPTIPVIIVTGTGSEEVAVTAMKRGAADYVIKTPQHIRRLPHTIEQVLEKKQWAYQRRMAEQELRHQANLLQNVSDAIISTDVQMNIESWNRAAEKIYGWQAQEVLGRHIEDVLQTEFFAESIDEQDEEGNEKGFWRGEVIQRRKDGTAIPVLASVSPINDEAGRLTGWVTVNRDITGRKRAEAQYRGMFESVADAVLVLDTDGNIFDVNPAACVMYGYPREDLIGRSMQCLMPPDAHHLLDTANAVLARSPSFLAETLAIRDDGTTFDGELRMYPFSYHGASHVLALVRDVTERKRLEREILEISSREQQRIGRDLHDGIGQELAAVSFRLADLEHALEMKDLEEATQVAELGDLIRGAMNQARSLAHGINPVNLEDQEFSEALRELTRKIATAFGVQCTFTCPVPVPLADPNVALHVYRILQEALNNAVRHGKASQVDITLDQRGSAATLTVYDNGVGFKDEPRPDRGMGLRIMDYRTRMISGTFDIQAHPQGGTLVTCSFQK